MELVEYLDRLPIEKIEQLRKLMGTGELSWKRGWSSVQKETRLQFGKIVFGEYVNKVWLEHEKNLSTGHTIVVVHGSK